MLKPGSLVSTARRPRVCVCVCAESLADANESRNGSITDRQPARAHAGPAAAAATVGRCYDSRDVVTTYGGMPIPAGQVFRRASCCRRAVDLHDLNRRQPGSH